MAKEFTKFINGAERAASHPVIYECSPEVWQDGFPVGNGQFGGIVYQGEGTIFEIAMTRLDLWKHDLVNPIRHTAKEIHDLLNAGKNDEAISMLFHEGASDQPCFKPGGRLRLELDSWTIPPASSLFDKRQELHLDTGMVTGSYEISAKAARRTTFVVPDLDVMVTRIEDTYLTPRFDYNFTQHLELYRLHDPACTLLNSEFRNGIGLIEFSFGETLRAAIGVKVLGIKTRNELCEKRSVSLDLVLDYSTPKPLSYSILTTTVVDPTGQKDLYFEIASRFEAAEQTGLDALENRTANFWRNFWNSGAAIAIENSSLEALYYYSIYQFAATSRGETAPGLFGLWNGDNSAPWSGCYTGDINLSMTYWPTFALNHPELQEPFFRTFEKIIPEARKETRELYGLDDALRFPLSCGPKGQEINLNIYRQMICSSAFYADLYCKKMLYYPQDKTLWQAFKPILEDICKFYLAYCHDTPDGSWRLGPSFGPEQGPYPAWNVVNDLGLVKELFTYYLQFAKQYKNASASVVDAVQKRLDTFPEYPQWQGEFTDSATTGIRSPMNHSDYLAPTIPGDDIDADSTLAPVMKKTVFEHFNHTQRMGMNGRPNSSCDLTWPWMFSTAIRLRESHYAEWLFTEIGLEYLKSNGMFAFSPGGFFNSIQEKREAFNFPDGAAIHAMMSMGSNRASKARAMSMLQQASGFLFGINESFLQSHKNELKIFPAMLPMNGRCQSFYGLRAIGGITVSAACDRHGVLWMILETESAFHGTIRFFDSLPHTELQLEDENGNIVTGTPAGRTRWTIQLTANTVYRWKRPPIPPQLLFQNWHLQEYPACTEDSFGKPASPNPAPGIRHFGTATTFSPIEYGRSRTYSQRY